MSVQNFTLKSSTLQGQATERECYSGCGGRNESPQLSWSGAPEGTKSFAVFVHDPDAPTSSGWWHWLLFDIPAHIGELSAGSGVADSTMLPAGAIQSLNDFGNCRYDGPCPPKGHGIHQYNITIYALDVATLGLDKNTLPAAVAFTMYTHVLAKSTLVFYHRRD
ncbi:MAG: YbhB/YbcL family Raf kinase inhibitor-like protein [Sphingobacteriales bacterium]|nr:YbhB/YbcL family Raf kinase inhibitor-like protein [Sphingobacteriales bacterium]